MKRLLLTIVVVGFAAARLMAAGSSVSGSYVEARTAEVFAGGCVINGEAGTAGRQAILAWKIDRGSYSGIALDGLSIVAAVTGDHHLGFEELGGARAKTKSAIFVDERANPAQRMALIAMASELSRGLVGTVVEVTPAPVQFNESAEEIRVAAGQVTLDVDKHPEHDPSCGASQWFQPFSSLQHSSLGLAARHIFTGSSLGTKWSDPNKMSAFFGTFSR